MAKSNKETYSLSIRIRSKSGEWQEWQDKGSGEWIGLQQVQNQIAMFRKSFARDMEIAFFKDGKYLDYSGNEIGKPIRYESK